MNPRYDSDLWYILWNGPISAFLVEKYLSFSKLFTEKQKMRISIHFCASINYYQKPLLRVVLVKYEDVLKFVVQTFKRYLERNSFILRFCWKGTFSLASFKSFKKRINFINTTVETPSFRTRSSNCVLWYPVVKGYEFLSVVTGILWYICIIPCQWGD